MENMGCVGGYIMKTVRSTLLNSIIFAGLAFGLAGSAFASEVPMAQPGKGILSTLGSGLWYSITHPKLSLAVTAGLGGLYLYACRANGKNWTKEINAAKEETLFFDATSAAVTTERNPYRYWHLRPGSASEIAGNWQLYYQDLKRDYFSREYSNEEQFIDNAMRSMDNEKTLLKRLMAGIDKCLAECNLLPRTNVYHPIFNNPVCRIVKRYLKDNNCEHFYLLTKDHVRILDKKIKLVSDFFIPSLLNYRSWKNFNWHRHYALPHEADAIEQYWKLYQMIAHLDAMQYCLKQARNEINDSNQKRINVKDIVFN